MQKLTDSEIVALLRSTELSSRQVLGQTGIKASSAPKSLDKIATKAGLRLIIKRQKFDGKARAAGTYYRFVHKRSVHKTEEEIQEEVRRVESMIKSRPWSCKEIEAETGIEPHRLKQVIFRRLRESIAFTKTNDYSTGVRRVFYSMKRPLIDKFLYRPADIITAHPRPIWANE